MGKVVGDPTVADQLVGHQPEQQALSAAGLGHEDRDPVEVDGHGEASQGLWFNGHAERLERAP